MPAAPRSSGCSYSGRTLPPPGSPCIDHLLKLILVDEVIIVAIALAGAHWSAGGRNHKVERETHIAHAHKD